MGVKTPYSKYIVNRSKRKWILWYVRLGMMRFFLLLLSLSICCSFQNFSFHLWIWMNRQVTKDILGYIFFIFFIFVNRPLVSCTDFILKHHLLLQNYSIQFEWIMVMVNVPCMRFKLAAKLTNPWRLCILYTIWTSHDYLNRCRWLYSSWGANVCASSVPV